MMNLKCTDNGYIDRKSKMKKEKNKIRKINNNKTRLKEKR